MLRKGIAVFTLIAFSFCSINCVTTKMDYLSRESVTKEERGKIEIAAVKKTSGETIHFDERTPAKIEHNSIVGFVLKQLRRIDKNDIEKIIRAGGTITEIVTKDGEKFSNTQFDEEKEVITFSNYKISIPISEVELVTIRRTYLSNLGKVTFGVIVALCLEAVTLGIAFR